MVVENVGKFKEINVEELTVGEAAGGKVTSIKKIANASQTVAYTTNVGAAGIGSSAVNSWLEVTIDGSTFYIPMWT